MKRTFYCCLLIGVVFLAASALAAEQPKAGCSVQGSWMSADVNGFQSLLTDIGESGSSGTQAVELFGAFADPTLGGQFQGGVKISTLRGVWERTGGNTFAYTQIWYSLDAAENILWIGKNSGTKTLSEDCNLMEVDSTLEFFSPTENPFGGTPFFVEELDTLNYHRMRVDPPATIPPATKN